MKTDAQRDADLAHVADMIEALLKAHNMTLLAEDIATDIHLIDSQFKDGKVNKREITLEIMPF